MAGIFNDGDPVDAARINDLQQQINDLTIQLPQIGKIATDAQNFANSVVKPQIQGGTVTIKTVTPGKNNSVAITFPEAFSSAPKSIVVTPVHGGNTGLASMQCWIDSTSVTATGAKVYVFIPTSYKAISSMAINYIAILHN